MTRPGAGGDVGLLGDLDPADQPRLVPVLAERLLDASRLPAPRPGGAPARVPGKVQGRASPPVPERAPRRPPERPIVGRLPGQANWPLRLKATALGVLLLVVAGNVALDLPRLGGDASPVAATARRWPIVQIGQAGTAVRTVQYLLVTRGYTLAIDGVFGPETQREVRRFQVARNLRVDGIVGPQTWSALVVVTQRGLEGSYVKAVQSELSSSGLPTAVDGVFGPITEGNVRAFQRRNGIKANGTVGMTTWNVLTRTRPQDPRGIGFEPPPAKPKPNQTVTARGAAPGGQPGTLPSTP
jgi:peptidoglycan hydrolase-like protein with peptidoglycan-binding domain